MGSLSCRDMQQTPHLVSRADAGQRQDQHAANGCSRSRSYWHARDCTGSAQLQGLAGFPYAELVDSRDPRTFAAAVRALAVLYQERDRLLGQHGTPNIQHLPVAPRRIVAVVSEFGALCDVAGPVRVCLIRCWSRSS